MKKCPEEIKLSREEGEALIGRLESDKLSAEDRHLLVKLIELYFWLTFVLRETKISLKRLKVALFGKGRGKDLAEAEAESSPGESDGGGASGGSGAAGESGSGSGPESGSGETSERGEAEGPVDEPDAKPPRRGHGRQGVQAYTGAQPVQCRHEELAVGQRCPACGRGKLYELPPAMEIRIDGHALLSAVRYELERLRCAACGAVFTAGLPAEAGPDKYTAQARAVLAVGRYYLGLPFYRMEQFQSLVGVPASDATQWDQVERVADSGWPVFEYLKVLAAQGELIYQDDTHVRILTLVKANRQYEKANGHPPERSGMYTTGLVVESEGHTICLYLSGRAHAGENLSAVLSLRQSGRDKPIVMSDALASNGLEDESGVIRSHCLAHGERKFTEIEEHFPSECQRVIDALRAVFEHEAHTHVHALGPTERLAYHREHSGPILEALKSWLEQQLADRNVEPNSSLGKAFNYLLNHWETLTRFLEVEGAPLDSNTVERALKLVIRQRKNSLFYASEHSAYVAGVLSSLIATCVQAGVNALAYLVALQTHRPEVFAHPEAWLPWNYPAQLEPG